MHDLRSLTRNQTHVPCIVRQIRNPWTTREVTLSAFLVNSIGRWRIFCHRGQRSPGEFLSDCTPISTGHPASRWAQSLSLVNQVEKAEEPEIKLPTSDGSLRKQESSRKISISALITMPKPLTVWITINCGKFWQRWEYQTTWPASWEICMQVRKQPLELDMEQQTGSKLWKKYVKVVYCHPAYLTYMQSTSWDMLGWKTHKLESRLPGEISITSDMQITPSLSQSLLMKVKEESEKVGLKLQKMKIMASGPITS